MITKIMSRFKLESKVSLANGHIKQFVLKVSFKLAYILHRVILANRRPDRTAMPTNLSLPRGREGPTHQAITKFSKLREGQRFGKHISQLFFGRNMLNGDGLVYHMRTEMMQADRKVFGTRDMYDDLLQFQYNFGCLQKHDRLWQVQLYSTGSHDPSIH